MKLTLDKLETVVHREVQPLVEIKLNVLNERSPIKLRKAFKGDDDDIKTVVAVYVPEQQCAYIFLEDMKMVMEKYYKRWKKAMPKSDLVYGLNKFSVMQQRHHAQYLWLVEKYKEEAVKMYYRFYEIFPLEDNPLEMDAFRAGENIDYGKREPDIGPIMERAIKYLKHEEKMKQVT